MESLQFEELLKAFNAQQNKSIELNQNLIKQLETSKIQKSTNFVLFKRYVEFLFTGFLTVILAQFVYDHREVEHLLISGSITFLFALIAFAGSIGQVVLLHQLKLSDSVIKMQQRIEEINIHGLFIIKLMLLSAPVWWAYVLVAFQLLLGLDIYPHLDPEFAKRYVLVNFLVLIPVFWAVNKLSYKNVHLNWVKKTLAFFSGKQMNESLESLRNLKEFQK